MFGKSVHYGRSVIQLKSVPIKKKNLLVFVVTICLSSIVSEI